MTPAATVVAPVEQEQRRRAVWKPLAAAGIGGAVLVATGFGVFATLTATASGTAQEVTSGSLGLVLASTGVGFTQGVANLAPTDTVHRFVSLTNNGTLEAQQLSVNLAATGSASLVTDGTSTRALRATLSTCSVAFTGISSSNPGGTCTGTLATPVTAAPLSALTGTETALLADLRASGAVTGVRISLTLPNQDENVHNGATPAANAAGTIQNQTASLTWTFRQSQRGGTTTGA